MPISKLDIIQAAYSQGLATGVTTLPTAEDIDVALDRLESMASELQEAYGVRANYNFEPLPSANSDSGLEPWMKQAFATNLMMRLCQDFGIEPSMTLAGAARAAMSKLMGALAKTQLTNYSGRMPIGSGQPIYARWQNHYGSPQVQPQTPSTIVVALGNVQQFKVDFAGEFKVDEAALDVTIEKTSHGVEVLDHYLVDNELFITLTFVKQEAQFVRYIVTGDAGTVLNRTMLFNVLPTQQSNVTGG